MERLDINAILSSIKSRHRLTSNYAVSQFLHITHQSLGNWLNGRTWPDECMCGKLADAAGLDVDVLIVYFQAMRSKGEAREAWLRIARRLMSKGGGAANFAAAFTINSVAAKREPEPPSWPLLDEFVQAK